MNEDHHKTMNEDEYKNQIIDLQNKFAKAQSQIKSLKKDQEQHLKMKSEAKKIEQLI